MRTEFRTLLVIALLAPHPVQANGQSTSHSYLGDLRYLQVPNGTMTETMNISTANSLVVHFPSSFARRPISRLWYVWLIVDGHTFQSSRNVWSVRSRNLARTGPLAVTTFLKKGGFDLLPKPALPWLGQIVQQKKADQVFWKTNGDETVELLRQLITEKGGSLSAEDRKAIILISDILTDNGVRGAGFLHQEFLRVEKVGM